MSAIYKLARRQLLNRTIDLLNDRLVVVLLRSGYVYSENHQYLADIGSPLRVAISGAMRTKTITTDGAFDAADVTFAKLAVGSTIIGAAIVRDTGDENSSTLIAFLDTSPELPLFTAGTDVTLQWNNNINRIFRLG